MDCIIVDNVKYGPLLAQQYWLNSNVSGVNTAINAVISVTDSITTIQQEQKYVVTEFQGEKGVFAAARLDLICNFTQKRELT